MGLRPVRPSGVRITGPAAPEAVASSPGTSLVQVRVVPMPVERSGRGPSGSGAVWLIGAAEAWRRAIAVAAAVTGANARAARRSRLIQRLEDVVLLCFLGR